MASVAEETRASIEADTFWCMTKLLDGIQDNYTFAQPGIQKKLRALKELVMRIDGQFFIITQPPLTIARPIASAP